MLTTPIFIEHREIIVLAECHGNILSMEHHRTIWKVFPFQNRSRRSRLRTSIINKIMTNLFQGQTQSPHHFSMPVMCFSASFISEFIVSMSFSMRLSCSESQIDTIKCEQTRKFVISDGAIACTSITKHLQYGSLWHIHIVF